MVRLCVVQFNLPSICHVKWLVVMSTFSQMFGFYVRTASRMESLNLESCNALGKTTLKQSTLITVTHINLMHSSQTLENGICFISRLMLTVEIRGSHWIWNDFRSNGSVRVYECMSIAQVSRETTVTLNNSMSGPSFSEAAINTKRHYFICWHYSAVDLLCPCFYRMLF